MNHSRARIALVLPAERVGQLALPPHSVIRNDGIWHAGRCETEFGSLLDPSGSGPLTVSQWEAMPQTGLDVVAEQWRQWISVLSRFSDRGAQFDLWVSEIALRVQSLAGHFQRQRISAAIFSTGVSHHADSMILQEGLRLAGVPQIHLYSVVVNGRLLPLLQVKGLEDRGPLGLLISDYDSTDDIAQLASKGASNPSFETHNASGRISRVRLAARLGYRSAKSSLELSTEGNGLGVLEIGTYGLGTYSRQMRQIVKARQILSRLEKQDKDRIEALGAEAGLIVMAHFQPEATSYAEAGLPSSHVDLVAAIRAKGWNGPIVYREHPAQWRTTSPARHLAMARSPQYYRDLQTLGCLFLPSYKSVNPQWLRQRRLTPVTMTGSIALERALNGWRTIVTGHPWFAGLPGNLSLDDLALITQEQVLEPDISLADESQAFLESTLNQKTLTNAPGIGTGAPLGERSWRDFERELGELIDGLSEAYGE